jgi:energy-coupling factor transporter ATP-binding protein EcfA2
VRLLVTGPPGSGKTTLSKALIGTLPGAWSIYHWDSYSHLAWNDQPTAVLRDLQAVPTRHVILEGVGAVRLLTQGTKGDRTIWQPDLILECLRTELASPSHKGMAGLIKSRLAPHRGITVQIADTRVALATLGAIAALDLGA